MFLYQEHNGYDNFSPVRSLGRRCVSIRQKISNKKTYLSAYLVGGKRKDLNAENMSAALEFLSIVLNYPSLKGVPVDRVDTHCLRGGVANALSLAVYSNGDMQKGGRCKGGNFKEYIREELHCFAGGMPTEMKQDFNIFNIAGREYSKLVDVTKTTVVSYYQTTAEAV